MAAGEDRIRELLNNEADTLGFDDVRELQDLARGMVEALGLVRAETWQILDALFIGHDTPFDDVLDQCRKLARAGSVKGAELEKPVEELDVRQLHDRAYRRFVEASKLDTRDANLDRAIKAGIAEVLRFGVATGTAVERGQVRVHPSPDSSSHDRTKG